MNNENYSSSRHLFFAYIPSRRIAKTLLLLYIMYEKLKKKKKILVLRDVSKKCTSYSTITLHPFAPSAESSTETSASDTR